MISQNFSIAWADLAPALGNHLWQSTVFALAAGLLTLVLRQNHAQTRYWLWLAASVKFLIPFSLLIGIGNHLAWARNSSGSNAALYVAVEEVSQPFTLPPAPVILPANPTTAFSSLLHILPVLLAAVWLCGFAVVLCVWFARWRRISAVVGQGVPLCEGREVAALRRLESKGESPKRIEMRLSSESLEPGIFGIFSPILLWPHRISERLEDAHMDAILAHELCHVRRLDNLAAAIHMMVEAIFWFHPLVWWLGTQLVVERERACDEAVLESGSDRKTYAESILKICEFCVGYQADWVSGVTSADLKKRIVRIMSERIAQKLDFSRKLLLSAAALLACAAPLLVGLLSARQTQAKSKAQNTTAAAPLYEVASIKANKLGNELLKTGKGIISQRTIVLPGEITVTNTALQYLIRMAYEVEDYQILGAPSWLTSELYDVDGKADASAITAMKQLGKDQRDLENRRMLQVLLEDQLQLKYHRETKEVPVYSLIVVNSGRLIEAQGDCGPPSNLPQSLGDPAKPPCGSLMVSISGIAAGQNVPMAQLVATLSDFTGRMVIDKTNLAGKYDMNLRWTPEPGQSWFPSGSPAPSGRSSIPEPDPNKPSLLSAIQEQLGLKLESQTAPIELFVIDHVERPVESQGQTAEDITPVFGESSIRPNKTGEPMAGFSIVGRPAVGIMWATDQFMATNFTLPMLLQRAYDLQGDQILGGPDWVSTERFDVEAKIDKSALNELNKLSPDRSQLERQRMLQKMLTDRFGLALRRETKDIPVYALVLIKNGRSFKEARPGDTYADGTKCRGGRPCGAGSLQLPGENEIVGQGVPIESLVDVLLGKLSGHVVLDKTGLTGKYDFKVQWPRGGSQDAMFTAFQEQLGLKLEPQTSPAEILIIDHAEKPSGN
jgi:bla regulator protein blaR1